MKNKIVQKRDFIKGDHFGQVFRAETNHYKIWWIFRKE